MLYRRTGHIKSFGKRPVLSLRKVRSSLADPKTLGRPCKHFDSLTGLKNGSRPKLVSAISANGSEKEAAPYR